jgi:hypothetical protein
MFTHTPELHDFIPSKEDASFVRELKMLLLSNGIDFPSEDAKVTLYNQGNQYGRMGQPRPALLCYLLAVDAGLMGGPDSSSVITGYDSTYTKSWPLARGNLGSEFKNGGNAARKLRAFRLARHLYEQAEKHGKREPAILRAFVCILENDFTEARRIAESFRSAYGRSSWEHEVAALHVNPPSDLTSWASQQLFAL